MNVEYPKSYIVLMMHKPYDEKDKGFYEQLCTALKYPVVTTIHCKDLSQDNLKHMIEDAIHGQTDITPVLVYQDTGWHEDLLVDLSDLVGTASIASLATGNPATTMTFDPQYPKTYRRGESIIYKFS